MAGRPTLPDFVAPGPGSWRLDPAHWPRPASRFHGESLTNNFGAAMANNFARYGMPMDRFDGQIVNGFFYGSMIPLDPAELPQRVAIAEETLATRRWLADRDDWDHRAKPESIARHRELADLDLTALDERGLVDHLRECADNVGRMIRQHHHFNGAAMVPTGLLLHAVQQWTDGAVPITDVLALLGGSSPVSRGGCPEFDAVVAAIDADPKAAALVEQHDVELDRLTDPSDVAPETADAIRGWIAVVGHRILDGFDVVNARAVEQPAVLVSCLRRTRRTEPEPSPPDASALRERIPSDHRAEFDDLLTDALATYRLRDERGIYSDATAVGLMRRAMLTAGERLVDAGRLDEAELATDAEVGELEALLAGDTKTPTSDELRRRRAFRLTYTVADAPAFLGDPPGPPPPLDLLPPAMARVVGAYVTFSGNMGTPPASDAATTASTASSSRTITGLAASAGRHEGTARLIHGVDDLDRVEEGDVVVAITTAEAFNLALSLASAVVTDQGGLLSHAAILAREYGIPAVVGTHAATTSIPDGARIVVDGTTGEVSW